MLISSQKILIVAPHTDDAELGCGGTIARLTENGKQVFVAAFSSAAISIPENQPQDLLKREIQQALPILGVSVENLIVYDYPVRRLSYHRQEVLEEMVKLRNTIKPDLVMLPSEHDMHQDHQVVYMEGVRAFKDMSILGYELPWNHIIFKAQAFVTLNKQHIDKKVAALQVYRSQLELGRPYFSREFVESLATVRGIQVKVEWAEAFEVIRLKW